MSLVYDFHNGFFVVSPANIVSDANASELLAEHIARHFKVLPLKEDKGRLMLLSVDPSDELVFNDIEIITGLKAIPVQLDLNGGSVPSWQEIESPPPAEAKAWVQSHYPEARLAIQNLIELTYLANTLDPAESTEIDEPSVIRLVDLLLATAINDQFDQLWILPRPKHLVVLVHNHQGWSELMNPTKFVHQQLLTRLKRLAQMDLRSDCAQTGSFQALEHCFQLETHSGENGEEALIRLHPQPVPTASLNSA